jgi:hypothetical protein
MMVFLRYWHKRKFGKHRCPDLGPEELRKILTNVSSHKGVVRALTESISAVIARASPRGARIAPGIQSARKSAENMYHCLPYEAKTSP